MTTELAERPDTTALDREIHTITEWANELTVSDAASYTEAGDGILRLKAKIKFAEDFFSDLVAKTHEAHKAATTKRGACTKPLKEAVALLQQKTGAWQLEQRRIEREQQERTRKAAAVAEEERRLAEAERLEKESRHAEAAAVLEAPPVAVPLPAPVSQVPTLAGGTTRTTWKHRIINASLIPRQYLMPNESLLASTVRQMRDATDIPGVEAYPETSITRGRSA